jgi:hypothetical protein
MRKDRTPTVAIVQVPFWPEAWSGWRFTASGTQLVSPDGDRFTPERLRGLGWRQAQEARTAVHRAREQRVCEVVRGLWRNVARERGEDGR